MTTATPTLQEWRDVLTTESGEIGFVSPHQVGLLKTARRAAHRFAEQILDHAQVENRALLASEQRDFDSAKATRDGFDELLDHAEAGLADQRDLDGMASRAMRGGGAVGSDGTGLFAAIQAAGWDRRTNPSVTVEFRSGVMDEPYFLNPVSKTSPDLGYDRRWLSSVFRQESVPSDATGVQSFRQTARTLAAATDMIRAIDETAQKPETDTSVDVFTEPLLQIASISSGLPNVLISSPLFRNFVEQDLRLAFGEALDAHVALELDSAGIASVSAGADLLAGARAAITAVQANGYSPSVIAASPEDLAALDLLQTSGPELMYVNAVNAGAPNAAPLWGLRRVVVAGLAAPLVLDPAAAGVVYVSPITFATFEENAGATNSTTARLENHSLFVVQRSTAIVQVGV